MPEVIPKPEPDAVGFNEVVVVTLSPGEQATVTFEPEQADATFVLPVVAISKFPESSYEVLTDSVNRFGPAPAPPTDPDDMTPTFVPALRFDSELKIKVANLASSSATRRYLIQPIGWEPMRGETGGN